MVSSVNIVEDWVLGTIDNRQKRLKKVLAQQKNRNHTLVEYRKSVSEFSLQCNMHKLGKIIFAGFPVVFEALENSIPLGVTQKYKLMPQDSAEVRKLKSDIAEDIRAAQGKLVTKGCDPNRPDYKIEWRDAEGLLNCVRIEFKKVGETSTKEQERYQQWLLDTLNVKTEEVHDPEEFWAVLAKYKIPNRGRGLF